MQHVCITCLKIKLESLKLRKGKIPKKNYSGHISTSKFRDPSINQSERRSKCLIKSRFLQWTDAIGLPASWST